MTGWKSYGPSMVKMPLAKGFTVIVGPNGSGKSNSIDAVNFCLGTLSSKSIRADKMVNLIYNGAGGKKPADKAIVDIVFDNSDYAIPIKEKEVVVTRELKRNGTGTYRLNGKRTTRTDILDKLRIAGIDVINSYNIIQQGQVGQIVGMNPIERRQLLEDLAGVGQFKEKKEAALKELESAQNRMNELQLLINEVAKRVESLRKEKNDAERWVTLDKEVTELKTILTSYNLYLNQDKVKENDEKIREIREEQDKFVVEKEEIDDKIEEVTDRIRELEDKLIEVETKLREIRSSAEEKGIERTKIEQKIHYNEKTVENNRKRIKELGVQKESIQKKIIEDQKLLEKQKITSNELIKKVEETQAEREQLEEELARKREEHDQIQDEYDEIEHQLKVANERLTRAQVQYEVSSNMVNTFQNNVNERQRRIDEMKIQIQSLNDGIASLEIKLENETIKKKELEVRLEGIQKTKVELESKIEELTAKSQQINDDYLVLRSKIETISSFLKSEEGKENPAVSFIVAKKVDGVLGQFQNLGKLPTELGHLSDAIITDSVETAVKCIKLLKESAVGTVNFIPLEMINLTKEADFSSIIKEVRSMNEVTATLEEAATIWKQKPTQTITTADGDVFRPNGIIYGGFHLLRAKEDIERLEKDLVEKKKTLDELRKQININKNELKRTIKEEKEVQKELKNLESSVERTKIQLNQQKELLESNKANLAKSEESIQPLKKQLQDRIATRDQGLEEIQTYQQEIKEILGQKEEIQQRLQATSVEPLLERINANEKLIGSFTGRLQGIKSKIEAIINSNKEKEQRIKDIEQEIAGIEVDIANLQGETDVLKEQEQAIKKQIDELRKNEKELADSIQTDREDLKNQKKYRNSLIRDKESISEKITKYEEKIHEIKLQRERFVANIEKIKAEIEESNIEVIEKDDDRLKKVDSSKINREITKKTEEKIALEPVNMKALKEFSEENKRYMELLDRREILLEERQVILDFIDQIETEKLNIFMKTFRSINKHFGEIFFELSNGKARLILEKDPSKGEDVFEGGVFIEAHPAGKKVASIESMSGGEKALTALAFIFAVQTVDAQPFYILDEIDAALDPMNVRRVAKLLYRMSRTVGQDDKDGKAKKSQTPRAQFLVISHRDILMAWADRLYGCTNVKGLSSIFSIKLTEDKKFEREQFT